MEVFKKLGPAKLALSGGVAVFAVLIVIFLSFKLSSPPMSLLYTNLSQEDSAIIVSRLSSMNEQYVLSNNGKDVSVVVSKAMQLRMMFAQEGIPTSGNIVGYEIFDKSDSLGTSQFVYNVNLVRALEGEISRTISSIQSVESARVHLVLPKKELFSKTGSDPSASIVLKLKGSQVLNKQEVAGISHLVATAVPGLKVDNITIVDNRGRPLKLAATEDSSAMGGGGLNENAAEYQKSIEEKYKGMIEDLLEKSIGMGKIKANVSAEINFDREVINSETYDPDGQVVRSKKVSEESESDRDSSSDLSAATNIPGGSAQGSAGGGGRNKTKTDEITNFEISKTISNKISESGRIKRLSIAILVDGVYTPKVDEKGITTGYDYAPRPESELEKIKLLASSTVGIDQKRGDTIEVINMKFSDEFSTLPSEEKPFAWVKDQIDNIVQTVVIGLVIILVILLIIKPVVFKAMENKRALQEEESLQQILAPIVDDTSKSKDEKAVSEEDEDLSKLFAMSPSDRKKVNMIKYLNDLVERHPEETVAVIRNWLYASR